MADARAHNDRRMLRFFGEDKEFMAREEAAWARMVEQDRAALTITGTSSGDRMPR